VTCLRRRVNRFDRLILGARTHAEAEEFAHQPACRLLALRVLWASMGMSLVAVLIFGATLWASQRSAAHARQQAAEVVANQCVDKAGNISYRNVLADLVRLNERTQPLPPAVQRQRTAAALRRALQEAGEPPACSLKVP
jgi:hypothetical protein